MAELVWYGVCSQVHTKLFVETNRTYLVNFVVMDEALHDHAYVQICIFKYNAHVRHCPLQFQGTHARIAQSANAFLA